MSAFGRCGPANHTPRSRFEMQTRGKWRGEGKKKGSTARTCVKTRSLLLSHKLPPLPPLFCAIVTGVSSLLMGLAPSVCGEQMANSQQIGGARSEHQGVGGEAGEKQRACLAASRDSKRDVTANPIRKTATFNPAGPPDSRRLAVAAAADGIEPKNRRCRAVACGGVSGDWVADDSLMRVVSWREERIPPVTQCQNACREVPEQRTRSNIMLVG